MLSWKHRFLTLAPLVVLAGCSRDLPSEPDQTAQLVPPW
jgi:hypothetical protein